MDFEFQDLPAPPPRSTFVNVLAWIFIVLGSLATFISVLQNLMVQLLFPREQMAQTLRLAEASGPFRQLPAFYGFLFNHFDLFFLGFLVASSVTLILAIGLLKRKNWARLGFMALLVLGIVWNLGGMFLQFSMFDAMPQLAGPQVPPGFASMMTIMKVANVAMAAGISVLFGWLIYKLGSKPIRAEFRCRA